MSVIARIRGSEDMARRIAGLPVVLRGAIEAKMREQAASISVLIKDKLSGPVLSVKSGRLRASIYARVYSSRSSIVLSVGSRGDVPYAGIREYGGVIHHPGVSKAKLVVFQLQGGGKKFTQGVAAHDIVVRETSYIRSTVEEDRSGLVQGLRDAARESLGGR